MPGKTTVPGKGNTGTSDTKASLTEVDKKECKVEWKMEVGYSLLKDIDTEYDV